MAWTAPAERDLRRLTPEAARRVVESITKLAADEGGDVVKLKGRPGEYRLRVGEWRVLFGLDANVLVIHRVLHRREAYR